VVSPQIRILPRGIPMIHGYNTVQGGKTMHIQPYTVHVPDETLLDLQDRLARTRWPDEVEGAGWDYGFPLEKLRRLVSYWRSGFNWRSMELRINAFPNFLTDVDGMHIHFIHRRGQGPNPIPLLITHGWPSTFYEMLDLVDLLTDPASHAGDPADAFDVVVPSVPGHGFSDRPEQPGFEDRRAAGLLVKLMEGLGYSRFASHASDLGASISGLMCLDYPEKIIGYHTTSPGNPSPYIEKDDPSITRAERDYLTLKEQWSREEYGYGHLLGSRPQTIAYALNDSPAGLAAWILEKWQVWTDSHLDLEDRFNRDDLLAQVTIYWVTQTINSANRYYYEGRNTRWPGPGERALVPHGVALSATQANERPPREYVERLFPDIRQWVELPRGGHFVAMEEPGLLAGAIRSFFRLLR
jgi:pimeloyl-ACP methyl ester carboxylesterase